MLPVRAFPPARKLLPCLAALATLLCLPDRAAPSENLDRMLRRLFSEREFQGESFGPARWVDGGSAYTTVEPAASGSEGKLIVRYDSASGERTVLVTAEQLTSPDSGKPFEVDDYSWSSDGRLMLLFTDTERVWRHNTKGSYWLLDRETGSWHALGGKDRTGLMFAKFSPDGSRVAYVRDNNICVEQLKNGAIRRITRDGSATIINGTSDWVYEEEFGLRDGFRWSPDGASIAYWQFDTSGVEEFALINYTDSLYPVIQTFPYPKAGQTNSAARVGVVDAKGGKTVWMKVPGDPRNNYIARMEWAENSSELVLEHLNRLQNTNRVLLANARNGAVRPMFEDRDDAWLEIIDKLEWTRDDLLWVSERDGWRRAYTVSRDGEVRPVTRESADILSIEGLDEEGGWLYYIASPENATQRYLYRARVDGSGGDERVTPRDAPGVHAYEISPGGRWAFHTHSRFNRPPVTELVSLPDHRTVRILEDNAGLRSKAAEIIGSRTEFFQVAADDGVTLDGWMIRPRNFDPARKYPVFVFVYGEPAGTTVVDRWAGANTLFHAALADEGYLIVSFDNRGTPAPKGRAWRKVVYGAVGVLSAKEQAAALRALAEARSYIDLSRVAVWGRSGGGSNTLNLMFRSPDLYKVGISVAPVPDQRLYDTIYQERYMGLPQENTKGYESGSPIQFAEGLKGKLLLIHGTADDNVHFQGTQKLINRLIELEKQFDFMEYPNRTHAISEGKGTRLHLHTLIARYLIENLPPGGRQQ